MPERITPNPLRKLGADPRPERPADDGPTDALSVLSAEFERALALKARLSDEAPDKASASARTIVASLEGMSRFALKMGLVTAAQSRELFAQAKERGLYEGWQ